MNEVTTPHLSIVPDVEEAPEVYDAERAVEEVITSVPVDQSDEVFESDVKTIYADITNHQDEKRAPIVPTWLKSKNDAQAAVKHMAGRLWYRARYHAWNSPKYLLRALRWSPVGAGRMIVKSWRWVWDAEQKTLRTKMIASGDTEAYLKLKKERKAHVRHRLPLFAAGLLSVVGVGAGSWFLLPWYVQGPLWVGAISALARYGRPLDKPITSVAVQVTRFQKITAERVREALVSIGVSRLTDPKKITFPIEIGRDGPGQLARVNLPPGVEAIDVCEKRGKLSSALRMPIDQVWPTVGPDHEGQLDLWIAYVPVSKMKPPKWSLVESNAVASIFEPISFGADQRQRPISTVLFERNWLIGGMPGSGKSYAARALALAAAMDSTTEFRIAEFKGTGDFMDFEPISADYVCGVDDEALDGGLRILEWGVAEAEKRGKRILKYKKAGRAPEGKVTPELAAEPGSGLHPVVILIDEAHELFLGRPEAGLLAERLIRRGRAFGIIVILATQIPDKDSLPTNITRCVNMRWCLAVQDQVANDMILGTGSYKRGVTGTNFRPRVDAGWGMVTGLDEGNAAVRSFFPSESEGKKMLARALQLRNGVIPMSEEHEVPRFDILYDVQRVWPADRPGVHWQTLAELLADFRPEVYSDLSADSVSSVLRGLDVPSEDVKVSGQNRKGCKRVAVESAIKKRELTR